MKAVCLLSSGLDSTINISQAVQELDVALALTFDYGQRAALQEIKNARALCEKLNVKHKVVDLSWFADFTKTSLVNKSATVPTSHSVSIDDMKTSEDTAKAVWVPNRNGIFLNIAAAFAEGLGAKYVIPGFNLEEAQTFADNSVDYMKALDHSFSFSTKNKVEVKCFTENLKKTEIVRLGQKLGVDFDLIWPCYLDGEKPCGQCESCQRYQRALKEGLSCN